MKYKVRLIRGEGAAKETRYETVEADGATMAYIAAMKSRNASEMWTPVGWEEILDTEENGIGNVPNS